jgi:pimeloyl-ACP methyl ester carboxylesterase
MARTPVLFVPGICGSFNLTVLLDWRGPTLSGWGFPPFINYGQNFLDAFEKAGYKRDSDLFVAFYDWRKSVKDSATTYLKPWIDRAKQRSGAGKVILVGHSMGGLVSRSYIQSAAYANDVERLITLGTPHRGSGESYYSWGGGEPRSDPTVKAVFDVYLWYLRHVHPFQTGLSTLKTIRTQVPSIRDLLPIDNYLFGSSGERPPLEEDLHLERNLVVDMLSRPEAVELLLGRVSVSTLAGVGFGTIKSIVVGSAPRPPGDPVRYPDGEPLSEERVGDGDGTVLQASTQIENPKAKNLAPLQGVAHSALPDSPAALTRVFGELGVRTPVLGEAPVQQTQLVIMTASPVTMLVEAPGGAPVSPSGVLGAVAEDSAPRRPRRVRARDHGHSGKHLNIAVIPNPPAGPYRVRLNGTATGTFALGAMIVSAEGVTVLGGTADGEQATQVSNTPIATAEGRVAAGTELIYEVTVASTDRQPGVRLDRQATAASAADRLRAALGAGGGTILGGAAEDPVGDVLGGGAEPEAQADALSLLALRALGAADEALAEALITQLQATKE